MTTMGIRSMIDQPMCSDTDPYMYNIYIILLLLLYIPKLTYRQGFAWSHHQPIERCFRFDMPNITFLPPFFPTED